MKSKFILTGLLLLAPACNPLPNAAEAPAIRLISAQATKKADFSYEYVLRSSGGFGTGPGLFKTLTVRLNGATVNLVQEGKALTNDVALKTLAITPGEIRFTFAGHTPNPGDRAQVTYSRLSSPERSEESNSLTWTVN